MVNIELSKTTILNALIPLFLSLFSLQPNEKAGYLKDGELSVIKSRVSFPY